MKAGFTPSPTTMVRVMGAGARGDVNTTVWGPVEVLSDHGVSRGGPPSTETLHPWLRGDGARVRVPRRFSFTVGVGATRPVRRRATGTVGGAGGAGVGVGV